MQTPDGKWRVEFDEPWAHEGAKPPDTEVELEQAVAEPAATAAQRSAA
jgi:DNA topoisomerase-3